jgi:hypothetical protein
LTSWFGPAYLDLKEVAMITLRIPPHLFALLRSGFEEGACDDAPLDSRLLNKVRAALIEADVASMPGLPVILTLETGDELQSLTACFEVGSETNPAVSDDQYLAVQTVLEQAALTI